ncbi:Rhodanese-like domain-containing protein [Lipomyces orientalis]|uniref:Rhodanese-like domain-containing protein n=1 Tax=Lipomyces orientalis TaxID=1233043 RepID=A0ACC3TUQ8_9ASCO
MDRSSPLAAMMPPPSVFVNEHEQAPPLNLHAMLRRGSHSHQTSMPNIPAFREFDKGFSPSFDSPTTTLAADLSQNFHIAKSPVLPTPRRSLLPSFSFGAKNSKLNRTPPAHVSSSPSGDSMDVSPLPHKSRPVLSATSSSSSSSSFTSVSSLKSFSSNSSFDSPQESSRQSFGSRPISRPKAITSFFGSNPNFAPPSMSARSVSMPHNQDETQRSLDAIFAGIPNPGSSPKTVGFGIDSPGASNSSLYGGFKPAISSRSPTESPLAQLVARPAIKGLRAKCRRTQSMFQKPGDVLVTEMNESHEILAATAVKNRSPMSPPSASPGTVPIPSFSAQQDDPFKRIAPSTLVDVLDGKFLQYYDRHVIVDCRFEYEFEGGHIVGAVNVNSLNQLEELFLNRQPKARLLLIFHCEYSAHRAPRMALHLRNRDRHLNMHRYPELHYPDIYILDGGYSNFFSSHISRCEPQHYVEMTNSNHRDACEREMNKFRKNMRGLRSQSYSFTAVSALQGHSTSVFAESRTMDVEMTGVNSSLQSSD